MRIQSQTFDHVLRADAPLAHCSEEARPYTTRYSSLTVSVLLITVLQKYRQYSTTIASDTDVNEPD